LAPGDRLLLYSDGFTEARMPDQTMLEEDGLLRLVQSLPPDKTGPDFLDALYDALSVAAQGTDDFTDDISAALLEYSGA